MLALEVVTASSILAHSQSLDCTNTFLDLNCCIVCTVVNETLTGRFSLTSFLLTIDYVPTLPLPLLIISTIQIVLTNVKVFVPKQTLEYLLSAENSDCHFLTLI